jgi:hypothetical protein
MENRLGPRPPETFKKHWLFDRVSSSLGYTVTLRRDCVRVRDATGEVTIDAEWAPGRRISVLAYPSSMSDDRGGRQREILPKVERAFAAAGWQLKVLD